MFYREGRQFRKLWSNQGNPYILPYNTNIDTYAHTHTHVHILYLHKHSYTRSSGQGLNMLQYDTGHTIYDHREFQLNGVIC